MKTLKILVVEDEMIIANSICDSLEDLGYDVLEPEISYTEAITSIIENKPDLVFLDIQLSGKRTGIDIARYINEHIKIPFIFLSSNSDKSTVQEAKATNPATFLVKPFTQDELYVAVEVSLSNFQANRSDTQPPSGSQTEALFIKQDKLFVKIKLDEILFIQSEHVYINIFTSTSEYLHRISLSDILLRLNRNFARVHRSYLVNLTAIDSVDNDFIYIDKHTIPLGKSYKEEVFKRLQFL